MFTLPIPLNPPRAQPQSARGDRDRRRHGSPTASVDPTILGRRESSLSYEARSTAAVDLASASALF